MKRRERRKLFRPHAVVVTERTVPQPMFVAAVIGVDNLLRLDLDLTAPRATFARQALCAVRARLARWGGGGCLPAFGRVTGFVVNYAPDRAVRFDIDGTAVEVLPCARRLGEVVVSLS